MEVASQIILVIERYEENELWHERDVYVLLLRKRMEK